MDQSRLEELIPVQNPEWSNGFAMAMHGYDRRSVADYIAQLEADLDRVRAERDDAVTRGEDLKYQVEVLRAKLHEARLQLADPQRQYAALDGRIDQMLRNAQLEAERIRQQTERELMESRAQSARLLQEAAQRTAQLESEWHAELASRRAKLEQELNAQRQATERQLTETVRRVEQLRAETEQQCEQMRREARAEAQRLV
ncbi:hypothetical protein TR74_16895, partial [Carbonactinospora thermoautotrophica]